MNNDIFQIITIISLIVIAVMVGLTMKKNHKDNYTAPKGELWVYYQARSTNDIVYSILEQSGNDFIDININQKIWTIISDKEIKYGNGDIIPYQKSGDYITFAMNGQIFGLTPLPTWLRDHGLVGKNIKNICANST